MMTLEQFNQAMDNAMISLESETPENTKDYLEEVRVHFNALQSELGTLDREAFDLGFNFKLLVGQWDEAVATEKVLPFKIKVQESLQDIRGCVDQLIAKPEVALVVEKEAIPETALETRVSDSLEQQVLMAQTQVTEHQYKLVQLETQLQQSQAAERLALERLVMCTRKVGKLANQCGRLEALKAEMSMAVVRSKIAIAELSAAVQGLQTVEQGLDPSEKTEQTRNTWNFLADALNSAQTALLYVENGLHVTQERVQAVLQARTATACELSNLETDVHRATEAYRNDVDQFQKQNHVLAQKVQQLANAEKEADRPC